MGLIEKDKQSAFDIAMGRKPATDTSQTTINGVLAQKALDDGNYALYDKLTTARSLDLTRKGQDIAMERGNVTENSTDKYVKQLLASRLDALGKNYLSDLKGTNKAKGMEKVDAEIGKVEKQIKTKKLNLKDALSLLDELSCL